MPLRTLLVLLHHNDRGFESINYLIKPLIAAWQAAGIRVAIAHGPGHLQPADLLFPHLDLTVIPRAYQRSFEAYARVVNRTLVDISKRRISMNLLGPRDDYAGPVIVKTDRNYGGLPEQNLATASERLWRSLTGRPGLPSQAAPAQADDWKHVEALKPSEYPVFPALRDVPRQVFANRRLVVEKFLPEQDRDSYAIRYAYFLGEAGICYRLISSEPATKYSNAHRIERVPVCEAIEVYRRQQGLDYGKIDFVMREGVPVVLDVNRTPALRPDARSQASEIVETLAGGLETLGSGRSSPPALPRTA